MSQIVQFPGHAGALSLGYKSGRSSYRDTPVTRSTSKTRKGGTSSHWEIAEGEIPRSAASLADVPALSIAAFKARFAMLIGPHLSTTQANGQALLNCRDKARLYSRAMSLGKRIRLLRKRRGMTLKQLGNAVGVTDSAVSNWEREVDRPDIDHIPSIVNALKTTADFLLLGNGDPDGPDPLEMRIRQLSPHDRALISGMLE